MRLLQLVDYFLKTGYEITFVATATEDEHSSALEKLGIRTKQVVLNCDTFNDFLVDLQPTIVLFDRYLTEEQFGWRVAEYTPEALRILDTEDLHSLRHVREQCFRQQIAFSVNVWLQDDKTKREIASIFRCDLSLIISDFEMNLLSTVLGENRNIVHHLPFMVDTAEVPTETPSFEERTNFLFIGGGKHAPNIDAIKHLKNDIWPKIRKQLPKAKMNIYGAYLPQKIQELNDTAVGFYVRGKAETVSDVMQKAKVCLAPLRFGAGIKGKLLHAMQYGTPSVTTEIGAEGMYGQLAWNGSIADGETDFVNAAISLYSDKTTWEKAQRNGYRLLSDRYEKSVLEQEFSFIIKELINGLEAHRRQNFIGGLLQHQTLKSTKYMGKWIQEKNKMK